MSTQSPQPLFNVKFWVEGPQNSLPRGTQALPRSHRLVPETILLRADCDKQGAGVGAGDWGKMGVTVDGT